MNPREHGVYLVTGNRAYRGHEPGTRFEASLQAGAEYRAINRRDIRLLSRFTPSLQPGSFQLPTGWAPTTAEGG